MTRQFLSLFVAAFFVISLGNSTTSWAGSSLDSPTLIYSNADKSHADKMAKKGTNVMYLINAAALGTIALKQDGKGFIQYAETMIASTLITVAGKEITHRQRPDNSDHKSFPSGHVSGSFAPAAFLYYRYGAAYGVPAFVAATFVAYTRVEDRKHYITDTLAGAAVGILSAKYFTTKICGSDVMIAPSADTHSFGINIAANF